MKTTYITAVLDLVASGHDAEKLLVGLKATLKRRGHESLLSSVLHGALRQLQAKGAASAEVRVVSTEAFKAQEKVITKALHSLGSDVAPIVLTDKTLVGGFVAEYKRKRLDRSYKTALVSLYRTLTK